MNKNLFFLAFIFNFNIYSSNIELYHRVKIQYENTSDLDKLSNSGICTDHGIHKKNEYFETDLSQTEINILEDLDFNYSIEINDVSQYYRNINNPKHKDYISGNELKNSSCDNEGLENYETPINYIIKDGSDFGGFYTYSEMLEQLDLMHQLYPNLNNAEDTGNTDFDFCANGLKIKTSNSARNNNGSVYIYMAFAENPFVTSTGIPATAG